MSQNNSIIIEHDYGDTNGVGFPAEAVIFLFPETSKPALGPVQTPIQRIPGNLSVGV